MRTSLLYLALATALGSSALPLADDTQVRFVAPAASYQLPSLLSLNLSIHHLAELSAHIASLTEPRLVKLSEDGPVLSVTEGEKALLVFQGKRFIDVTDEKKELSTAFTAQAKDLFPSKLNYKATFLEPLFNQIDVAAMKAFLIKFSGFRTRYYRSSTGRESQLFLLNTLKDIAKTNKRVNVTFSEFVHPWGQNSIIARFEPSQWKLNHDLSEKIVIVGAHQDSTNVLPFLSAPGADDDGSGTTTLVTAFTVLVNSTFSPSTNPVEFHFYSAEEGGLLGSQAVAQAYATAGKQVRSMLQMDMTAWVKAGTEPVVGIITDFVSPEFTEFIRSIVGEYAQIPFVDTKCGYGCSDHASWTKVGAPSAFTIESTFEESNHNIHSSNDRIDYSSEFSFEHMTQFTRIAIALVVELGGGASLE